LPQLSRWLIRTALVYLLVSLMVGVAQPSLTSAGLILWPTYVHLLVVGWLTQLIFGVAYWMFPRDVGGVKVHAVRNIRPVQQSEVHGVALADVHWWPRHPATKGPRRIAGTWRDDDRGVSYLQQNAMQTPRCHWVELSGDRCRLGLWSANRGLAVGYVSRR
jgi:hypothetical protein